MTLSPFGDEMTAYFAKTLIDAEGLGNDAVTDFLGVSFSVTDYVGHFFGPSSLEAEDNLLHLDRTLADLFAFVDDRVGLENTLIVLSADHGAPEAPGYPTISAASKTVMRDCILCSFVQAGGWDFETEFNHQYVTGKDLGHRRNPGLS